MAKSIVLLTMVLIISLLIVPTNSNVSIKSLEQLTLQRVKKTVDGDPVDWVKPYPLHPPVYLDGSIGDWYTEYHWRLDDRITRDVKTNYTRNIHVYEAGGENKFLYYKGEFIWFDALGDTRVNIPFADLTEVRITGNETHLLLAIRVREKIPVGPSANRSLLLSLLLDTDLNWRNGNTTTIDRYTTVSSYGPWDYQITLDFANMNVVNRRKLCGGETLVSGTTPALRVWNSTYKDVATNKTCFVVNSDRGFAEIAIYWKDIRVLNSRNVSNVRLYALAFVSNGTGVPISYGAGSAVIDVVSNLNTDEEVSDNTVDYWVDIGFSLASEPASYHFYVLDPYGRVFGWSDLSSDHRTDYVPDESFDLDILGVYLHFDEIEGNLYFLIHLKGNASVDKKISPVIAIVIDDTPTNCSDGYYSSITIPSLGGLDTQTELGTPISIDDGMRSCKWFRAIWIVGTNVAGTPVYWVAVHGLSLLYNETTVTSKYHFIEGYVPLSTIDPNIHKKIFRIEVVSFAYSLTWIDNIRPYVILDIPESNMYDCLAPYPTWGNGTILINGNNYTTFGEIYYGEIWVDAFNTNKLAVNLNAKLYYLSYDKDNVIELGEYAWVEANLTSINYTNPLPSRRLHVYLVSTDYLHGYIIGTNETDDLGYFYLYVGELASRVRPGVYRLLVVFEPVGADRLLYPKVEFWSVETYIVANRPFMTNVSEPRLMPLVILVAIIFVLLLKRYYDTRS